MTPDAPVRRPGTQRLPLRPGARFTATAQDQLMSLVRPLHDQQCRCVLELGGVLDLERMARAIRLTLDAEPVLGCRFVERPWRPTWERRDDLDSLAHLDVSSMDDRGDALRAFLGEPLDPATDPLVQVRVFRRPDRPFRDTLAVKISHVAADGRGLSDYVRLLARAYRGLGANPGHRLPTAVASRGQARVFRAVGLRPLLRASAGFRLPRSAWGVPAVDADTSGRAFAVRTIGPDRLAATKAYGMRRASRMNDILLAAFYRAMFEVLDPPARMPLPVQMTVDLRRHLHPARAGTVCNLSGVYFPVVARRPGEAFERTLAATRVATRAALADQRWLGGAVALEMATMIPYSIRRRAVGRILAREIESGSLHPFFANLGALESEQLDLGEPRVEAVTWVGPVPEPPGSMFTAATFNGTMTATMSYSDTAVDGRLIDGILDAFVRELPE